MKNTIFRKISFVILVLLFDNACAFSWSDLDPTNKNSAVRQGVRKLDPTDKNSAVRQGVKELDITNKNSGIRGLGRDIDPTSLRNWEQLANSVCAKPFQILTTTTFSACVIDNGNSGTGNINRAIELLVEKEFYKRDDFSGVQFFWCTPLGEVAELAVAGMVPVPNVILLSRDYRHKSAFDLVPLIGHEMVHIKQIREKGFDKFACQYSGEILSKSDRTGCDKRSSDKGNFLECEAYSFEDKITSSIETPETPESGSTGGSTCVSVDSRRGWQRFNLHGNFTKVVSISGGWSVDSRSHASVGASGHSGRDAEDLAPYNQYKYDQGFPFGALLMGSGQGVLWIQNPKSFNSSPFGAVDMRINDADNALSDNGGSLQVCFGN